MLETAIESLLLIRKIPSRFILTLVFKSAHPQLAI